MPYVERNSQNYVVGRYLVSQPGYAEEWLDDGHPDLSAKTPEQLAVEAQKALDAAAKESAKLDAVIQYLVTHTPDECAQYVQDNVVDLPSAKAFLKKVAIALSVLTKRELR